MMPDSKRFLHPETIARIARLEMRARHIVEGFLSGIHRSPYFGQSIEFLQHREYTRGDDPAAHRLESLGQAGPLLRQAVRRGHQPPLHAAGRRLRQHAVRLGPAEQVRIRLHDCRSLAYLLLRQQDSVGCVSFDAAMRMTVPPRSKREHLNRSSRPWSVGEPQRKDRHVSYPARASSKPIRGAA